MSLSEVPVAAASPERFRALMGAEYAQIEKAVEMAALLLTGRVIWHVNSTARGGGVAELLASLLAYARGAGVDVRWMTVSGNPEFFAITKRIHNHLHGSDGDGGELNLHERSVYERALADSADELAKLVRPDDIVYLHDPQTAGLVDSVRRMGAACVWRCHVGVDDPNDLARAAWDFLLPYVDAADAYVFSRESFAWEGLNRGKLWIVPPSIDAFSAKNQEMDPEVVHAILTHIGFETDGGPPPVFRRQDGSVARVDRVAEIVQDQPVPRDAPVVAQVSRWDRLKDPCGVLDCFAQYIDAPDAHLVLVGPSVAGVADDPEGAEVLAEVTARRAALPEAIRVRTHLISLPMDDTEENAVMVNAIQRRADVIVQKSLAEGFGLTVAEAMWKARPVVAGRIGGIQDQIVDGASGILVDDPADLAAVGNAISGLLGSPEVAARMGAAARERIRREFLGSRHLIQYMDLIGGLLLQRAGEPD